MPRPRILGSPRSRPREGRKDEEAAPKVVTIGDYEEPDCEIIKIEDEEDEEEEEIRQESPVRVAVHGVAEYSGAKSLPSLLSLQLVPSASTKFAGGQNVVMVMPMVGASSRVFNPTLCTVEKIENPTEITQIQRVVGMQRKADARDEKRLKETREKIAQTIFQQNSAENRRIVSESRIVSERRFSGSRGDAETTKNLEYQRRVSESRSSDFSGHLETPKSPEIPVKTESEDGDRRTPSSSIFAALDPAEGVGKSSPPEEKVEDEGETRDRGLESLLAELPDTSDSESVVDESFSPRKYSDNSGRGKPRILSSENSPTIEGATTSMGKKSAGDSSHDRSRSIFKTRETRDAGSSPKIREVSAPVVELRVKIDAKKASRAQEAKNRSVDGIGNEQPIFQIEEPRSADDSHEDRESQFRDEENSWPSRSESLEKNSSRSESLEKNSSRSESLEKNSSLPESLEKNSSLPESLEKNSSLPESLEKNSSLMENREKISWQLRCIVCRRRFTDRTELHKHATLAHPGVQILFCDLCSDSFLTHGGLDAHRAERCGAEIAEITETIVIDDDEDVEDPQGTTRKSATRKSAISEKSARKISEKSASSFKRLLQVRRSIGGIGSAYPKLQLHRLPSGIVKSASARLQVRRLSAGVRVKLTRRGRPPKKFLRKRYAEREVVDHVAAARREDLGRAEIKELVVPLARLEGATLSRYLEKRAVEPVTTFQSEGSEGNRKFGRRNRRGRANNYNKVGNFTRPRRTVKKIVESEKSASDRSVEESTRGDDEIGTRKRSAASKETSDDVVNAIEDTDRIADSKVELRSVDSDSGDDSDDSGVKYISIVYASPRDVNRVIGIEAACDSRSVEGSVIRKLPSRSSAASASSLRAEDRDERRKRDAPENSEKSVERSGAESANDSIEEFDPEQFEEIAREEHFSLEATNRGEDRQKIGADLREERTGKKSVTRKTYLPSKRRAADAKKSGRSCDEASREICLMCKELFALMRQLAGQFVGDKANKISVKCPLCNLYFISMFFLKKHVANHHLQCQVERPCRAAQIAPIAGSASDAALDCETKVALAVECLHCSVKFSEEKDLVDHVFAQHDLPIFTDPAEEIDLRRFVDDLEAPSTSREKIGENRPIVTGKKSVESVDERVAGDSGKAASSEDQKIADRENLLKQLLSDDSTDESEAPESDTKKVPISSSRESRSQDLLLHSLENESEMPKIESNAPDDLPIDITDLFADSPDYHWNCVRPESSTMIPESGTTAAISEPTIADREIGDDIFASGDESHDFSGPFRGFGTAKIEGHSSPREIASKRKSPISEKSAPRSKRAKAMQQLLETEEGLANAEEPSGKLPIECGKCNRKFPNQEALNEHLFFLHDDSLKDTVLTDVVSPMSRLRDETTAPRQWRCDKCSHNFKLLQSYSRHRYFVHGDDEFVHVCENCCKVLTSVTTVNVHICTDVASYNCRTCNETFATGLSLRLHNMYKHKETEGPHVCRPCDKRFLTNAMLKRHEKWKHRFLRPYRPRKRSPVRMAAPRELEEKIDKKPEKIEEKSEKNLRKKSQSDDEMDSGCDQEYPEMEYEFTGREIAERRKQKSSRKSDEYFRIQAKNSQGEFAGNRREKSRIPRRKVSSVCYVKEEDVLQCDHCRLLCLSPSALRSHRATSHAKFTDFCRVCKKSYPRGRFVKHVMDRHVNPCENYAGSQESIWKMGGSVEERDAEELIGMLGMTRLISLCEYQRFGETSGGEEEPAVCPTCGENLEDREAYKLHFFERHDVICALCNIEFKSGDKAAIHKIEEHGSIDSYVWFADETVAALTAATNFCEVAEKKFIEMISRESDEESDEAVEENYEEERRGEETKNETCGEIFERLDEREIRGRKGEGISEEEPPEIGGENLVIVVNDDDIAKFGIGTEAPNIWGLAAKISATCEDLTPMDVKAMLEWHFER